MTTVTLDLPKDLYHRALTAAEVSHRSIEQVVVEWIQPPSSDTESELHEQLVDLDRLSDEELMQVARFSVTSEVTNRLQYLLELQQQQSLTPAERREVESLVYQEDLHTLRKAKALFLLRERGALPAILAAEVGL